MDWNKSFMQCGLVYLLFSPSVSGFNTFQEIKLNNEYSQPKKCFYIFLSQQ